jgi:hypothetical protein
MSVIVRPGISCNTIRLAVKCTETTEGKNQYILLLLYLPGHIVADVGCHSTFMLPHPALSPQ